MKVHLIFVAAVVVASLGCGNPVANIPFDVATTHDSGTVIDAGTDLGGGNDVTPGDDFVAPQPDAMSVMMDVIGVDMSAIDASTSDTGMGTGVDVRPIQDALCIGWPDVPVVVDAPPPDATPVCSQPFVATITPDYSVSRNLTGSATTWTPSCGTSSPEDYYALVITQRSRVEIFIDSSEMHPVASIRRNCTDVTTEVGCNASGMTGSTDPRLIMALDPGTYTVVVSAILIDMTSLDAPYSMQATVDPIVDASNCATAPTINCTAVLSGQSTATGLPTPAGCAGPSNGTLYYNVLVPPGMAATVTASDDTRGGAVNMALGVEDVCNATVCLDQAATSYSTLQFTATVVVDNHGTTPRDAIVALYGENSGEVSPTIEVDYGPVAASPASANCATAPTVTDGMVLSNQDTSLGYQRRTATCDPSGGGRTLYYTATIPPGDVLTATITDVGSTVAPAFDSTLMAMDSCSATTCITSADRATTISVSNGGASARTVIVAVGSAVPYLNGRFDLHIAIGATTGTTNAVCSDALPLSDGLRIYGVDPGTGVDMLTGVCLPSDQGPVLYYQATVPAGQTLAVGYLPGFPSVYTGAVRILSSCGASTCLASSPDASIDLQSALYRNTTATAQHVVVAVGYGMLGHPSEPTWGQISAYLGPGGNNGTCATARTVSNGTHLTDENVVTGAQGSGCGSLSDAVWYEATVPAGQRLTVAVTPTAPGSAAEPAWTPSVSFESSCAGRTCVSGSLDALGRSYSVNSTSGPETMYFTVSSAFTSSFEAGPLPYALDVEIGPGGSTPDAGAVLDAGMSDVGTVDAGVRDSTTGDAGGCTVGEGLACTTAPPGCCTGGRMCANNGILPLACCNPTGGSCGGDLGCCGSSLCIGGVCM